MTNNNEIVAKIALQGWDGQIARAAKLLNELTDDQLSHDIAPGKNSGTYLIGHLLVVHDMLNDILGLGKRSHPELDDAFLKNPDKSGLEMPPITTLRDYWKIVHAHLAQSLHELPPDALFTRHNSISDEDFVKEPHRNKLSVVLSRTTHAAYHLGQLQLLK